jgi:hypothetical protein
MQVIGSLHMQDCATHIATPTLPQTMRLWWKLWLGDSQDQANQRSYKDLHPPQGWLQSCLQTTLVPVGTIMQRLQAR